MIIIPVLMFGCGQTGSTLMGPLQKVKNMLLMDCGKRVLPGTFGKIKEG